MESIPVHNGFSMNHEQEDLEDGMPVNMELLSWRTRPKLFEVSKGIRNNI